MMPIPLGVLLAMLGGGAASDIWSGTQAQKQTGRSQRRAKKYTMQAAEYMEDDPIAQMIRERFQGMLEDEPFWRNFLSDARLNISDRYGDVRDKMLGAFSGRGQTGSPQAAFAEAQLGGRQAVDWNKLTIDTEQVRREMLMRALSLAPGLSGALFPKGQMFGNLANIYGGKQYEGTNVMGSFGEGLMAALGGHLGAPGGGLNQSGYNPENWDSEAYGRPPKR